MAFVCPPKEDSERKSKLICDLKNVVDEIEKNLSISAKPICVPCCIPVCDLPCSPCCVPKKETVDKSRDPPNTVLNPPNVMVCYKVCQKIVKSEETNKNEPEVHRIKQSKSRELRASILYTGCDCEKRDGLQDDCQRTGCHGSPECLTHPPTCGPSEFSNGKHLGKRIQSTSKMNKNGNGNASKSASNAKYKCFPAIIKDPICCTCISN